MRILVLKSKSICYNSTFSFADSLAAALQRQGFEVEIFSFAGKKVSQIEALTDNSYDAVIDFNSKLPQLIDDETGEHYLDQFHAPFFNYILDHPLYHHDNLKEKLADEHVICLDYNHAGYIRKYYPWIKSVSVIPIAANAGTDGGRPFSQREYNLLFTGTYTDPEKVMQTIDQCNPEIASDIKKLADTMLSDTDLTMEAALEGLLLEKGVVIPPPKFARLMQLYFLADTYVSAYVRDGAIRKLLDAGMEVDVVGHGWDAYPEYKNLTWHGECDFNKTMEYMANSKAVLNVMPWFKDGCHDRIMNTMQNGAVSITDESGFISRSFENGRELLTFSLKNPDQLVENALRIREDDRLAEEIASNGKKRVQSEFTWDHIAAQIFRQ